MNTTTITRRKYTEEDELTIIDLVKQYPTNLDYAFRQASIKIGRGVDNISATYYARLRKKYPNILSTSSKNGATNNIKNALVDKETGELTSNQLQPYQMVLRDLLNLPEEKRKLIIKLFV